jgi:UDP-glucose-4-epimerase GalE
MKNILVVGGAGYIGSYMCKYLYQNGFNPVTLDNLRTGHEQAVKWGPFIKGSLLDRELLHRVFTDHSISAVMHFAARSVVWESVARPGEYYENNVSGIINLLNVMLAHDVGNIIFSSTCAVYGRAQSERMTEDHPLAPYTPYGQSKLMSEKILVDFGRAHGMHSIILRYFNAAGADPEGETGEAHSPETHLIPIVLQAALGRRDKVMVYGRDYPTKDGTCIRDFIHIHDLAAAMPWGWRGFCQPRRTAAQPAGSTIWARIPDIPSWRWWKRSGG